MEEAKKSWLAQDLIILLILAMPFIFVAIFWDQFPDRIPVHYDSNFKPDRYDDKATGLLLLPGVNVLLYILFRVLPIIDPFRKNFGLFIEKYKAIQVLLHLLITYIFFIIGFTALGYKFPVETMFFYGLIIFFLVMGNYMSAIRRNFFIGIRTPWTLVNENVWVRTHRFTAKLWVSASLAMLFAFMFFTDSRILFFVYLGILILAPVIYSYLIYAKLPKQNGFQK